MSITRQVAEQVVATLNNIRETQEYADKAIERTLKMENHWRKAERGAYVNTVYQLLSLSRKLEFALGSASTANVWHMLGTMLVLQGEMQPDWEELQGLDMDAVQTRLATAPQAVTLSYPDWLHDIASAELGAQWPTIASAMNERPTTYIRVNRLKTTPTELQQLLRTEGVESWAVTSAPDTLRVADSSQLFKTKAFHQGWFEMQDLGSQQIAPLLDVKPGLRVVDGCCGAGGKSLHLAALMANKGYVLAMDIHEHKLATLKKRAKRAGVHMIETRQITSSKTVKRLKDKFDRVLLDVPCTGTGVFKRNPDAKWQLEASNLAALTQLQGEILQRYSQMCKAGGYVVYATCSILPSENQQQIAAFLAANSQFSLEQELVLLPGINTEGDGFYAAKLKRND
ncbi:RsmB/NOP family class I SAM-dependent RNA methyltransferase [Pseudoalteromonas fenneropenaei]|uniref:RsmB/NOP family class I SAM-dependent RNA methyltransferase n=1 Tax=Pseudoalteromonas fenneropenaei TaxID=1737459 RepID=A0ABV7CJQ6_9GAMM